MDAAYYVAYRAAHRERINAQRREQRSHKPRVRGDRSAEYTKRRETSACNDPLPALYPELQHGVAVSFWEDELRMDLAQEHALLNAMGVRGKDRQEYLARYRTRETNEWKLFLSLDTLSYASMERACSIETVRHKASRGEQTPAICHEGQFAVSHDLCDACFAFAQRARRALEKGAISADEARERVRRRLTRTTLMPQTTRLQKPCIGYYDKEHHRRVSCGKLCPRSRCPEHEAMYQATRRPPASQRGYDAQYRKDRARLLAPDPRTGERVVCELQLDGCTLWADTADHDDPMLGGKNIAARRGPLTPACAHCNSKRGSRPVLTVGSSTRGQTRDVTRDTRGQTTLEGALESPGESGGRVVTSGDGVLMPDGSVR